MCFISKNYFILFFNFMIKLSKYWVKCLNRNEHFVLKLRACHYLYCVQWVPWGRVIISALLVSDCKWLVNFSAGGTLPVNYTANRVRVKGKGTGEGLLGTEDERDRGRAVNRRCPLKRKMMPPEHCTRAREVWYHMLRTRERKIHISLKTSQVESIRQSSYNTNPGQGTRLSAALIATSSCHLRPLFSSN